MRRLLKFAGLCVGAVLVAIFSAYAQKQMAQSPKITSAKTVYFEDRTVGDRVGEAALLELKKWGRFQVLSDQKKAHLIFLLSADPRARL